MLLAFDNVELLGPLLSEPTPLVYLKSRPEPTKTALHSRYVTYRTRPRQSWHRTQQTGQVMVRVRVSAVTSERELGRPAWPLNARSPSVSELDARVVADSVKGGERRHQARETVEKMDLNVFWVVERGKCLKKRDPALETTGSLPRASSCVTPARSCCLLHSPQAVPRSPKISVVVMVRHNGAAGNQDAAAQARRSACASTHTRTPLSKCCGPCVITNGER